MLTSIVIGVAVFALQVGGYIVITRKLAARRQQRNRIAGLVTRTYAPLTGPVRNRLGED